MTARRSSALPAYVSRIDEIVSTPPFYLRQHESHGFFTRARRSRLQDLADRYLNDPLGPNAPVYFAVPSAPLGNWVHVSFNRYGRAGSIPDTDAGWLTYTEVLIAFMVLVMDPKRWLPRIQKAAWLMPCLYLDGTTRDDPGAVPIMLGRECFGLHKNPGRIEYAPTDPTGLGTTAELKIFDADPLATDNDPAKRYTPKPAIQMTHGAKSGKPDDDVDAFYAHFLESATGVDREEFGKPWRDARREQLLPIETEFTVPTPGLSVDARSRDKLAIPGVSFVFGYELLAPMVGLQQFRDPRVPAKASYQAVVESHLVADIHKQALISSYYDATFPSLARLDLVTEIGLEHVSPQPWRVPLVYYRQAESWYADPGATRVWQAP